MLEVKAWILMIFSKIIEREEETFIRSPNEISLTEGGNMMEVQNLDNQNPRRKSYYTLAPMSLLENAWILWTVFIDYSHVITDLRSIYWMSNAFLGSTATKSSVFSYHIFLIHLFLPFLNVARSLIFSCLHRFAFEYECCAVWLHSIHL